jgi:hypothetical protein
VQFRADPDHGNRSMEVPVGAIQPDGSFELQTGTQKGAPPGWWKVLVVADNFLVYGQPPHPDWTPPKPLVNERYLAVRTSDVAVEVVDQPEEGAYVLKLNP